MNISYKIFYLVELCNFDIKSYFHLISSEKIIKFFVRIVGFHCRVVNRSWSKKPPITTNPLSRVLMTTMPSRYLQTIDENQSLSG